MKKGVFKTSLIVIVLFLIVREFLPFDISLFNRESNWNSDTSNSSKMSFNKGYVYSEDQCIDLAIEKEVSLFFTGLEIDYEEVELSYPTITVDVADTTSIGFSRFIPLYKVVSFTSNNSYIWTANACYRNGLYSIKGTGNVEITGTERIIGICSGSKVKKLIDQVVVDVLDKQVFDNVSDQFNSVIND